MRLSTLCLISVFFGLLAVAPGCGGGDQAGKDRPPADAARGDVSGADTTATADDLAVTATTSEPTARGEAKAATTFSPGPDAQMAIQEELILAEPGDVIQFEEGVFELTSGLSLDVENVTIRGRGMDKTILSFKNQEAGAEGLYITSNGVTVEDLAIEDTKGNGLKSHSADNIVIRRVRAEWTGGPKSTNGAYGIYPVSSRNVLIEDCVAIGGSDSGVYVGQSKNVIIRNCRAEYNVAGIEIENCHDAEAYGNTATKNTGGILVFDLPDLPQQRGHNIRVYDNKVFDNNTPNFAPPGNIVGTVPTGTGMMVMANSNVEFFGNDVRDHGTISLLITSYISTGIKIKDPNYVPYPSRIHVHDNTFGPGGDAPAGRFGEFLALVAGTPLPDIVWDGVVAEDGDTTESVLSIHDNHKSEGPVGFANLGAAALLEEPTNATVLRDLSVHATPLPSVTAVVIEGVE